VANPNEARRLRISGARAGKASPTMSRRTEAAAIVALYRELADDLNAQAAVLHGDQMRPVIKFMEAHRDSATAALQELDRLEHLEVRTVPAFGAGVRYLYQRKA
jgi:hypothetical protein